MIARRTKDRFFNVLSSSTCRHAVHVFFRKTLRSLEDSFANTAKRPSISRICTRACMVLLVFGSSLVCSASSCWRTASESFGEGLSEGKGKRRGSAEGSPQKRVVVVKTTKPCSSLILKTTVFHDLQDQQGARTNLAVALSWRVYLVCMTTF